MTNKDEKLGYLTIEKDMPAWYVGSLEGEITVNIGLEPAVIIDKLFGPWAVWEIKCRLDYETGSWIIEQAYCETDKDGNDGPILWKERARFSGWPDEVKMGD